ncbi:MAG: DUF4382 domain-containing protein, partial [Dysgonomonadaceae bacterium]|nr:DUF4382 domain-containing protein [Dysgonamonadaceae bacterium]
MTQQLTYSSCSITQFHIITHPGCNIFNILTPTFVLNGYLCSMIIPRTINKAVSIAFAGCLLLLISCTEDSFVENSARLRISLTESSSIPLSEANLQITSIEVMLTDSTGQSQDEWIPLEYAGGTYNLLKYLKGETKQIADQYFSAGTITQIRIKLASTLHIVDKYSLLSDQQQLPVDLATEYQDGVVVAADIPLTPNVITDILLDFNLAQSIYKNNTDDFVFVPYVRAYTQLDGGMLKGTISPVEAVPMVQIGYLTDTLSTFAASDGSFYFQGLRAGLWEIHVIPLNTLYADTTVMDTVFN